MGAQGRRQAAKDALRQGRDEAGQQATVLGCIWGIASSRDDAHHAVRATKRHYHRPPLPSSTRQRIPSLLRTFCSDNGQSTEQSRRLALEVGGIPITGRIMYAQMLRLDMYI